MTPEVIKTLIEIANEQQQVMAARPSPVVPPKGNLRTNPDFTPSYPVLTEGAVFTTK